MSNQIEKQQSREEAIEIERRLMMKALARRDPAAKANATGRLIFAIDLTRSRKAALKQARIATAAMFETISSIGGITIKLAYFRGGDQCRATRGFLDAAVLSRSMLELSCEAGPTQIASVLRLALAEPSEISGVVFIGDQCEEKPEVLIELAVQLGLRSLPLFIFHECSDTNKASVEVKPLFKRMAEASRGIYVEFAPDSGTVLNELLAGIGAFSAAGKDGLRQLEPPRSSEAKRLRERLLLGPSSAPNDNKKH